MRRFVLDKLNEWKTHVNRKPLLIKGARQVGKTWIMKEFARLNFEKVIYVNFEREKLLSTLFEADFDVDRILLALQLFSGISPVAGKTLLIFDEIQEAKGGLTALKYFHENAPQYHVVGAGSLLGIALQGESFPVGKVDFLELHPLSFSEFLLALNEESLLSVLQKQDWKMIQLFHEKFVTLLKQYYFVGGMPEVVNFFAQERNFSETRKIQESILIAYEQDFSKHAPHEIIPRIRMLWNSLPAQLAKENKKFIYGLVKEGARAKEYETALAWLEDYGLIHRVNRVSKVGFPLKSYIDFKAFKLFVSDVGLLCALSDLNEKIILEGNRLFTEFKGALTEQFILQQLLSELNYKPFYWSEERSTGEIDFLIQSSNNFYPIEVKAEENLQSKSLKNFHAKYAPQISVRTSLAHFKKENWLVNIPLYAIREVEAILTEISEDLR